MRTILPASGINRVPYPGGFRSGVLTNHGARIAWDDQRVRPKLEHWARYLAMGIVVLKPEMPEGES